MMSPNAQSTELSTPFLTDSTTIVGKFGDGSAAQSLSRQIANREMDDFGAFQRQIDDMIRLILNDEHSSDGPV